MTVYDVSRADKGTVARLEWDEEAECGAITYLRFDPPFTYELKSRKLYEYVRANLINEQQATLTEVPG